MPTILWNGGYAGVTPITIESDMLQQNTCSVIQQKVNQSVNADSFLKNYKLSPNDNSTFRIPQAKFSGFMLSQYSFI